MKLVAQVSIDRYRLHGLDPNDTKEYVTSKLADLIKQEILKHLTISSTVDPINDVTNYTGTMTISSNGNLGLGTTTIGTNAISGANYTANRSNVYSQINMRVVEYTKNGKVTRVELQKYDENDNDWVKIPRIQIEE
jgi:hypothetical protein